MIVDQDKFGANNILRRSLRRSTIPDMPAVRRHPSDIDPHRRECWARPITLRLASDADAEELRRLAALETRALPCGPFLIATRDGAVEAAISLSTGDQLANPFRRTAELCALLRSHASDVRVAPEPSASAAEPRAVPCRLATVPA
jgi:hypothetical protein